MIGRRAIIQALAGLGAIGPSGLGQAMRAAQDIPAPMDASGIEACGPQEVTGLTEEVPQSIIELRRLMELEREVEFKTRKFRLPEVESMRSWSPVYRQHVTMQHHRSVIRMERHIYNSTYAKKLCKALGL